MDFEKYYDEQKDYAQFRNNPEKRKEYEIWVQWKVKSLLKTIPDDLKFENIIEIGCAFGVLLKEISTHLKIKSVFGLDISSQNISLGKSLYPDICFIQGTLENTNLLKYLEDKSHFEVIILSDIVEHIPDDHDFFKRVSKIGKYVLLNLPLEKSFITRNRKYGETDSSGHLRCYDEKLAMDLINNNNFKIRNKFIENFFKDPVPFSLYIKEQKARVRKKTFLKKTFWSLIYPIHNYVFRKVEILPKKIYGSNLFCFLESTVI
jgi:SAM-dependent methyltransferase